MAMRSPRAPLRWVVALALAAAVLQAAREFAPWLRRGSPWVATLSGPTLTGPARVIDGDSIEIAGERIRLFGIDAPEARQECHDHAGVAYPCGREAARALAAAIGQRAVTCTAVEHDRYERGVAICRVDDHDLGEAMVRSGHAFDYGAHSRGRYIAAEREAREARRGLWAGTFEHPMAWRRRAAGEAPSGHIGQPP
jgi:endonuclease YncB( thermonuclease family)